MKKTRISLVVIVAIIAQFFTLLTATTPSANAAVVARPNAIQGTYTAYSFVNAITGATGNGSEVTFTFNPVTKTGTGSDWRTGDYITVTFPSSNATTTAYNLGQVAITAITSTTITVASTVKVDTAKYPNTVALSGLTSSSTGIRAGTLTVTRDPNSGSTPNGCSVGGTMTISDGTYDVPKYVSLGQAINNGSTVKIAAGEESVDQGIYAGGQQFTKTLNGTRVSGLSNCKGTMYIPEGVKSLSSPSGQTGVTNIAFPSTMEVVQNNSLTGYTGLVALNLDPVKYLMTNAFISGCNITSLSLGSTFQHFGKQALQGCANLTSVALPASIRSLGEWTFGGSAVTYFDLPPSFTCTDPGLLQESGCDWKIGQYFFGGQPGQSTLAPSIKINIANIQSSSTRLALQRYLGTQTQRGTVSITNDPNCTIVNKCKTTTFVSNPSGNLLPDAFGRTGMSYDVGNFPSVVFTQNSNEGPEKSFTQRVTSGATTQLSAASNMSFSKTNNTFVGWNTEANGSGTTYLDLSSVNITSTLYLYAQWSPIYTYTVNLNRGTGGTGTQMTAMTGTAVSVALNANTYSRTGYTFNGWNTAEDGTGTSYTNQQTIRLTGDNQTITLYAQWLIITYTITYLPGPDGSSSSSAQTLNYGGSVTLKDASAGFTRTGYVIVGWTTSSASGAAKTHDLSSAYSSLSAITLYPVWGVPVYAITWNDQGATTASSGGSTTYTAAGAVAAIPTTAPLRSGYTFAGWNTAANGTGSAVTNGSYTPATPYGAVTFYAKWTANSNNITWDLQGATTASSGGSNTYTTGTAVAAIPTTAPLKTGYTFAGWNTAANGTGSVVTNGSYTPATPFGAISLYAQWTADSNNITWDLQGATTASSGGSNTYTSDSSVAAIPTTEPLKTGYTFAGWNTAADGTGSAVTNGSYTPATPFGAISLYAQWTADSNNITWDDQGATTASSGGPASYTTDTSIGSLPTTDPVRIGYTFDGWFDGINGTGTPASIPGMGGPVYYFPTSPYGDVTFYAKWLADANSITWDDQGATTASSGGSTSYTTDTAIANIPTTEPLKAGYTFIEWNTAADGSGDAVEDGSYTPATPFGSVTLYAQWSANTMVVTYDSQAGSAVSNDSFTTGTTLSLPASPTRTGYTFKGWFAAASGGTALVSGYSPANTDDFTLYAQWTANSNSVTWNDQGATTASSRGSTSYTTATAVAAIPTTAPLKTGYTFGGWNTAANGTGTTVTAGSYTPANPYGAITFYAKWTANSNNITWDLQGATTASSGGSNTYTTATAVAAIPTTAPLKTGYTFGGWYTAANGTGSVVTNGSYTPASPYGAITFYAQWTANSNNVTWNDQGATTASSGGSTSYTTATAVAAIPTTAPLRTGYTFGGWYTAANGAGTTVTTGSYTPASPYGAITFYAKWSANSNNITWDDQGATTASSGGSATYVAATSVAAIPTTAPVKTGYTFAGWNTAANGTGTTVTAGSYTPASPYGAITLYAKWTPNSNNISWNNQGATTASSGGSPTYTTATAVAAIPTTAPLRTGYTFGGWNTAANGTGSVVTNGSYTPVTPFGVITFYAQWTANSNNVTWNDQGATTASSGGSATYTTATAVAAIPTTEPVKAGYTFNGWNTAANGTGSVVTNGSYTPASPYGAITLYAQWKANTYNVTYDSQLGSAVAKASWNFGSSLTLPAAPFRSGWTFKGWFPAATGGTALANGSTPSNTADFTLYAQWTANTLTVTYNSQSGSAVANGTCMTGSTLTLPAAPTRAGYTFSGWFTSPTGGTALVSGFSPSFIANFTLYAQWIAKTVNVTFNSQSGSAVASSTFTVGSTLTLPAEPTRSGYGFNGWFTAATGGTSVNSGYSPTNTADFTLYAQWNKSSEKPAGVSIANITFASGSSDLVAATRSILDSAIKEIIKNKKTTINLAGFTDSKGSAAANLILSKNRAVTVQKYLEKGLKSYKVKFNLSYYGSAKSVGTSAAAQALSRRVEIFVK